MHFFNRFQPRNRQGQLRILGERIVENSEERNVGVEVDTPQVQVKVVRDCSLHAVGPPVARAIVLVAEVGGDHDDVLILLGG